MNGFPLADIDFTPILLNNEFRAKIHKNILSNKIILGYYNTLATEYLDKPKMYKNILKKIDRIKSCQQFWELDHYKNSNVKRYLKTEYCKDKFCLNCKKWRQAQRTKKFVNELKKYDKDLYFVTFTVPNVKAPFVKETIYKIFEAHRKLVLYLDGTKKTRHYDFSKFSFKGGLRVLEISINRDRDDKYHIHIHCAYILENFILSDFVSVNRYSKDNTGKRNYVRLFSKEEIELQKLWYYFYNNIDLKKDVKNLDSFTAINPQTGRKKTYTNYGYSVTIDKFAPGQYQEMFKYMIKDNATYIDDEGNIKEIIISYDEFKTLYFATANVRQLEAYGVLKGIEDNDIIDKETVEEIFNLVIEYLNNKEVPEYLLETVEETLNSDSIYISKSKIMSYLRKAILEEFKENTPNKIIGNRLDTDIYNEIIAEAKIMLDKEKVLERILNKLKNHNKYEVVKVENL